MTPKLARTACSRRARALHPNELGKGQRLTHMHACTRTQVDSDSLKCFNKCVRTRSSIRKVITRERLCEPCMRAGAGERRQISLNYEAD